MIAVDRRGRLGNNMFQWAFGISAGQRLGTEFAMHGDTLSSLFELDGSTRVQRRLRRLRWLTQARVAAREVVEITGDDEPASVLRSLRDRARYGGFFQSPDFFSGYEDPVARAFTVRPQHRHAFDQRYGELPDHYACVHVRLGDYLRWEGKGIALPESYFRRCLDGIDRDAPVVFISDDLATVRSAFGSHPNARFEANEPIVDLQLMINAKTCIASNSSFAWWGAWLNPRPDKRVLAPRYWMGFPEGREWPRRVLPDDWEQVEVEARWGAWRDRVET